MQTSRENKANIFSPYGFENINNNSKTHNLIRSASIRMQTFEDKIVQFTYSSRTRRQRERGSKWLPPPPFGMDSEQRIFLGNRAKF